MHFKFISAKIQPKNLKLVHYLFRLAVRGNIPVRLGAGPCLGFYRVNWKPVLDLLTLADRYSFTSFFLCTNQKMFVSGFEPVERQVSVIFLFDVKLVSLIVFGGTEIKDKVSSNL